MLTEDDIAPRADETAHGIPKADTIHAYRQAMYRLRQARPDVVMLVGPARNGDLLEVGVAVEDGEDVRIVHSDHCRPKFRPDQQKIAHAAQAARTARANRTKKR